MIDINEGKGGVGFRIRHLWAMVAAHGDEDEGVIAIQANDGVWIPLVAADERRMEQIVKMGRKLGKERNVVVRLVRWDVRQEIETFYPDGRRDRTGN